MRLPLLFSFLAAGVSAIAGTATVIPPAHVTLVPGKYTGILTVRRTLLTEGLETTFNIKAEASIAADGNITILTAAPESPGAAANIENSIVRAAPRPVLSQNFTTELPSTSDVVLTSPLPGLGSNGQVLTLNDIFHNYLVNGTIAATVTTNNRMVYLNYSVPQGQLVVINFPTILVPGPFVITSPVGGLTTANSSPAQPAVSVNTSAADQTISGNSIIQPTPITFLPSPSTRVSYEFALRFKSKLTPPPTAVTPH